MKAVLPILLLTLATQLTFVACQDVQSAPDSELAYATVPDTWMDECANLPTSNPPLYDWLTSATTDCEIIYSRINAATAFEINDAYPSTHAITDLSALKHMTFPNLKEIYVDSSNVTNLDGFVQARIRIIVRFIRLPRTVAVV
jgi:hypothetical protein